MRVVYSATAPPFLSIELYNKPRKKKVLLFLKPVSIVFGFAYNLLLSWWFVRPLLPAGGCIILNVGKQVSDF